MATCAGRWWRRLNGCWSGRARAPCPCAPWPGKRSLGVNVGGLIGHCALRYYVMGERCYDDATAGDIARMAELSRGALIDGAAGLGYTLTEDPALPPQMFTRLEVEALVLGLAAVVVLL